jgi:hypothetical protein
MILESEMEINLAPSIGEEMNPQRITSWSQYQQMNIQCLIRMYGNNCKAELGQSGNPTMMLHLTLTIQTASSIGLESKTQCQCHHKGSVLILDVNYVMPHFDCGSIIDYC